MNILLKKVLIADTSSPYCNTVKDVLVQDGFIQTINDTIEAAAEEVVDEPNLIASPGWVDVFADFADPGFEHKETVETGAAAALAGGFTQVLVVPNTQPVLSTKTQVSYVVQKSKDTPVSIHPIGAVSKNCEGKELAEMYDMYYSGAVAFSDGLQPVQSAGILLKALQYVKAFDGVLIQLPVDKSINAHGLINEGIVSTQLGLPGIPAIAEELIIQRDIELLKYTGSKLHITGISTAKSVELIKRAKEEGLQITCSVAPYHLYFCDEDLRSYDTNLKVKPPLRTPADRDALRQAVLDGWIDCIATHHIPQHWDDKTCEFEYAKPGMIGLQTAFAVVQTVLPQLANEALTKLFSINAATIFNLPVATIQEGKRAELTLFNRSGKTLLTEENNKSKSGNTPFLNKELNGKVAGVINKGNLFLNI
ncbi:dihydroorotase [Ilyomonas limi]|uniref:Dihydroorotase n=1 Tax=Ilyomonas limi TaxID=2575867 RepID=A0A4U3KUC3_9BACT|nr:dihydroorotase [Ilyomonas limi]TKK66021.1 dihydroorotase [Ilyomonas limi]